MADETYNGWTNYPTWLVALWLDNDRGQYDSCREVIETAKKNGKTKEQARTDLMEAIEEYIENGVEDAVEILEKNGIPPAIIDYLRSFPDKVNFYEIANGQTEDYE